MLAFVCCFLAPSSRSVERCWCLQQGMEEEQKTLKNRKPLLALKQRQGVYTNRRQTKLPSKTHSKGGHWACLCFSKRKHLRIFLTGKIQELNLTLFPRKDKKLGATEHKSPQSSWTHPYSSANKAPETETGLV